MTTNSDKEVLVDVNGIGKKFCSKFSKSLRYGLTDVLKSSVGIQTPEELRPDEFWALEDISFQLRRGECIGLIGHNGAGKSTLLKILNGIINPDKGQVTIKGRLAALIELGAGFNPILTGRENIYNNGQVLGFSHKEIDKRLDEIITFSEIGDFIDSPVQNYSSGMKVRLGFAVAVNLDPDVLLIDEVLAVGDVGFRIKCYNKIAALLNDTAIIFVSHSMPQVSKISSQILLMDHGSVLYNGNNVSLGVEKYFDLFEGEGSRKVGSGISIKGLKLNGSPIELYKQVEQDYGSDFDLDMELSADRDFNKLRLNFVFFDKEMKPIMNCVSDYFSLRTGQVHQLRVAMKHLVLAPASFMLTGTFLEYNEEGVMIGRIVRYENLLQLKVKGLGFVTPAPTCIEGQWTNDGQALTQA